MEVKTPWSLEGMPDDSASIARCYLEGKEDGWAGGQPLRRVIAQEVGYMIDNEHKLGAISTYQRTFFLEAIDHDTINITDAVYDSDQDALRIWATSCIKLPVRSLWP